MRLRHFVRLFLFSIALFLSLNPSPANAKNQTVKIGTFPFKPLMFNDETGVAQGGNTWMVSNSTQSLQQILG